MNIIRRILSRYPRLYNLARAARFILISSVSAIDGSRRKFPVAVQLPLTFKCNMKCKMCNIWNQDSSRDLNLQEFRQVIKDPIFKEVKALGINGGEPALIPNLPDYAKEILELPKIKSLNVISNGFVHDSFLKSLEEIFKLCRAKKVSFHVSISLDGVGEIHDRIRGRSGTFAKAVSTIDAIRANQNRYCDSIDVGCTIIRDNIDYLYELDAFAKSKNYTISYRLGIENKRIESDLIRDNYSVIYNNDTRQSAQEFMHRMFFESPNLYDKFKYFSIFYWLNSSQPRRLLGCGWKDEGITMDARGDLYYCAVASDRIGGLREGRGEDIFFSPKNIDHRKSIIRNNCALCIHDYDGTPEFKNLLVFFRKILSIKLSMMIYRFRCRYGLI